MSKRISRRNFLKFCAAGAVAVPIAQLAAKTALAAPRKAPMGERLLAAATQPLSSALPSNLVLGQPLADISMGWDGSVWGIDSNGAPYQYDQVSQSWQLYSGSFDVVTYVSKWQGQTTGDPNNPYFGLPLIVRGTQVITPLNQQGAITDYWHNLPDSFRLGLDGAAQAGGVLYLFRHGRYVAIDDATGNASAPVALTSFSNWPTSANWSHGAFEAVGSNRTDPADTRVRLWSNGEYIRVDMGAKNVFDGPNPISLWFGAPLLTIMEQGFSADVLFEEVINEATVTSTVGYQGLVQWGSTNGNGGATAHYLTTNQIWTPNLMHAPSGSIGALYGIVPFNQGNPSGSVIKHDGTGWQGSLNSAHNFFYVSVGSDGVVFSLSADNGNYQLQQLQSDGVTWKQVGDSFTIKPVQLSVGDTKHIWMRDNADLVYQWNGSSFVQVTTIDGATHIAATPDGAVWHAKGDANAYRLISERTAPPTALNLAGGSAINKIAAAAFGTAFVLADNAAAQAADTNVPATQLYSYNSLYAFKTSASYMPAEQNSFTGDALVPAGNLLYVIAHDGTHEDTMFVTALDAQSGVEIWPNRFVLPDSQGTSPHINGLVYDGARNLIYVGFDETMYAINGAGGALVWSYSLPSGNGLISVAGLCNGKLCFGVIDDPDALFVQIDLDKALAASQQKQPVTADWSVALPDGNGLTIGQPIGDSNGAIYVVYGANTGTIYATSFNMADGSVRWHQGLGSGANGNFLPFDCLLGQSAAPNVTPGQVALFVNAGASIYALKPADGTTINNYAIPSPTNVQSFTSSMTAYNGQIFVGDNYGKLYIIDGLTMKLVTSTTDPYQEGVWAGVRTHPVVIHSTNPTDTVGVYFTRGDDSLWLLDPSSGNLEQLATDQTASTQIAYDPVHGLLYAMGWNTANGFFKGQVFALRPEPALQDERAFIIESQLMQDYGSDDEAAGNGVARYQTHVTIVDDSKAPMAGASIKLWADDDSNSTVVQIDGASYTIGTTQPALFTADASGSFVIVSDATDLSCTTLMVWAGFMDASERITIQPDTEFHQRMALTTASGSTDPSQTDPKQIDLSNAASYDGAPLFSTSGSDQSNASQAAQAITQTTSSAGIGASSASLQRLSAAGTVAVGVAATPAKYSAYANLPGMSYSAVNLPANLALSPVTPAGISISANGYQAITPAAASAQIDAMTGDETAVMEVGSFLSKLKDAWKDIKQDATKVVQAAVSIAKDIAVGIQYVVNGVTKVIKAVAQDIKDAMIFVGSLLKQLGKEILKAVEALSMLLHLGEIIKTAGLIKDQINATFTDMTNVLNAGKSTIDNWFSGAETAITNEFCDLFSALGLPTPAECSSQEATVLSTMPLNTYGSVGSTSNTVFNSGNTSGQSQSVQCGWSSHTLRNNMGNASVPPSAADADDPLLALLTGFIDSLTSNPQLAAAYSDAGNAFSNTFKVNSVSEFMKMAMEDILEVIKAVAITGVAVVQALADGMLNAVSDVITGLQNLGNMNIPILSALWKKITGNDLSFMDVICFVAAFPVTFVYRAQAGHYPSQDASASDLSAAGVRNLMGVFTGIVQFVIGIVTAIMDNLTVNAKPLSILWKLTAVVLLAALAGNNIYKVDLTYKTYPFLIAVFSTMLPLSALINILAQPPSGSVVGMLINAMLVYIYVESYVNTADQTPEVKATLSRSVIASFPGIINPVKFAGEPAGLIAPASDLVCRTAASVITLAQTILQWDTPVGAVPPPARIGQTTYFPIIGR